MFATQEILEKPVIVETCEEESRDSGKGRENRGPVAHRDAKRTSQCGSDNN
jgi:hypothetical protein